MKLRSSLMLGGAAWVLLAAMPVFAEEASEARVASDVVVDVPEVDPFAPDTGLGMVGALGPKEIRAERGKEIRKTMRLRTEVWELPSIDLARRKANGSCSRHSRHLSA